jgi:hypothetical protein
VSNSSTELLFRASWRIIAARVQLAGGELLLRVHRGGEQIVSAGLLLKQISAEICYAHT